MFILQFFTVFSTIFQLYQWKKALSRSLYWKDSATFTHNGDVVLGAEVDPFLDHLPSKAGAAVRHVIDRAQSTIPPVAPPPSLLPPASVSSTSSLSITESSASKVSHQVSTKLSSIPRNIGLFGIAVGVGFACGMLYQSGGMK